MASKLLLQDTLLLKAWLLKVTSHDFVEGDLFVVTTMITFTDLGLSLTLFTKLYDLSKLHNPQDFNLLPCIMGIVSYSPYIKLLWGTDYKWGESNNGLVVINT